MGCASSALARGFNRSEAQPAKAEHNHCDIYYFAKTHTSTVFLTALFVKSLPLAGLL